MRSRQEARDEGAPESLEDFRDFVMCYSALDKTARIESQNFRSYTYEDRIQGYVVNLDLAR